MIRNVSFRLLLFVLILALPGFSTYLSVPHYEIRSDKISGNIRIAFVSDLHSADYGEDASELLDALDAEKPDLLLLGGDLFDTMFSDENTEIFVKNAARKYPCYYATGNHEADSKSKILEKRMSFLKKCGVRLLRGKAETFEANGQKITVCGMDDPRLIGGKTHFTEQVKALSAAIDGDHFSLLLSHRPEYADLYGELSFDLVLCGHAHGGQWRIPLLVNGLYTPDQGLFPKYAGGRYELNGTTMIVSRGLVKVSNNGLPRLCNPPELVIIDIKGCR